MPRWIVRCAWVLFFVLVVSAIAFVVLMGKARAQTADEIARACSEGCVLVPAAVWQQLGQKLEACKGVRL